MGRSESATVSIGYRVSIRDLIESIHDEESYEYAYHTFKDDNVFVEDDNNEDNNTFLTITDTVEREETQSWESAKEELRNRFDRLLNHDLLIPVFQLADTTRWGYNREGTHGIASPVSESFSRKIDQLRQEARPHHTLSWIVRQLGG